MLFIIINIIVKEFDILLNFLFFFYAITFLLNFLIIFFKLYILNYKIVKYSIYYSIIICTYNLYFFF